MRKYVKTFESFISQSVENTLANYNISGILDLSTSTLTVTIMKDGVVVSTENFTEDDLSSLNIDYWNCITIDNVLYDINIWAEDGESNLSIYAIKDNSTSWDDYLSVPLTITGESQESEEGDDDFNQVEPFGGDLEEKEKALAVVAILVNDYNIGEETANDLVYKHEDIVSIYGIEDADQIASQILEAEDQED